MDTHGMRGIRAGAVALLFSTLITPASAGDSRQLANAPKGPEPVWIRQFGTTGFERTFGSAVDQEGNVYVVGRTWPPQESTFVVLLDANGRHVWTRELSLSSGDFITSIATAGDGAYYVSGSTGGYPADTLVIKFDADGKILWTWQPATNHLDGADSSATDASGNLYVAGGTLGPLGGAYKGQSDAFVIKYNFEGRPLWKRQPGTVRSESIEDVAIDKDGNVYVTGTTSGSFTGVPKPGYDTDVFVIKFDSEGRYRWKRQPGTDKQDSWPRVTTDQWGDVYVTGTTYGSLARKNPDGDADPFVIKFDADGHVLWKRQPGTQRNDLPNGIAADRNGRIHVVGHTRGSWGAPYKGGFDDAFVVSFDPDGSILWVQQPGTRGNDEATDVAVGPDGSVYASGVTDGLLGSTQVGSFDLFVIKYPPGIAP